MVDKIMIQMIFNSLLVIFIINHFLVNNIFIMYFKNVLGLFIIVELLVSF